MSNYYKTKILQPCESTTQIAANLLKKGELVAIPTETVYGLAANALSNEAVKKIFTAKNRPQDNPLISHISSIEMMDFLCDEIPESALKLAKAFWPGPLTVIVKRGGKVCNTVCAGLNTVAVRMPNHPVALDIISAAGLPLAAPSANLSGSPSPTTANHVFNDMNGKINLIVNGEQCEVGLESSVISLIDKTPIILRPGFITKEQIEYVLNQEVIMSDSAMCENLGNEKVLSPGMKYRHYSPKANVTIINASTQNFCDYVNNKAKAKNNIAALCFDGEEHKLDCYAIVIGKKDDQNQLAKNLFSALRELDEKNIKTAYAHCPNIEGVGIAVYNRMLRAAAFKVVNLND